MKVLFLLGTFPEISQTFILNQITGLIDLGVDVRILAGFRTSQNVLHKDIKKYELLDRAIFYDKSDTNYSRISTALKVIFRNFRKNYRHIINPLKCMSLHDLFLVDFFLNNKEKYDLVHAHFGQTGILGARLKEWGLYKGKLITSFYGYDTSGFLSRSNHNIYNRLFKFGDLFISLSKHMNHQLLKLGCPCEKIVTHHIGVNPLLFENRKNAVSKTIKLLSVARLVEKKGIYYAIKAFKKAINVLDETKVEYNIVGDGYLKSEYQNLIEKEGIEDKVQILGWKTQDEIRSTVHNSNIFILPSTTTREGDMEGTPVSIMEAMSCGKPVISTYHSGIPELINDSISGYLVPEKDIETLADRMIDLISKPESWNQMGMEGRKHIEKYYNINKLNIELLNIYRSIINI